MNLSIVLPVYNEGKVITTTITKVERAVKVDHEVLIIYDMDNDDTLPPVKKLQKQYRNIKLVRNDYGRGALNALKTGLNRASGGAVCVMMADLTDDPSVINEMYKLYKNGADVVAASRYMKGGHQLGGPVFKQILSRGAGLTLHFFGGIPTHDATNSFKIYSKRFLSRTKIESDGGFEVGIELTVKAFFNGYKVDEVPTTWIYTAKESRFFMKKWLPKYIKWYIWAVNKKLHGNPKSS